MRRWFRSLATSGLAVGLLAATVGAVPAAHAASGAPKPGTATLTIDGTTWEATADKGGCKTSSKVAKGITLPTRSFTGRAGAVQIKLVADPKNPHLALAAVRSASGDPHWDSYGGAKKGAIKVKGKTVSVTLEQLRSPVKDAEAVAARQPPKVYSGSFSFTC